MKRQNKKTYKAIKQAKAVITITQHGDVVKLNVDFFFTSRKKQISQAIPISGHQDV